MKRMLTVLEGWKRKFISEFKRNIKTYILKKINCVCLSVSVGQKSPGSEFVVDKGEALYSPLDLSKLLTKAWYHYSNILAFLVINTCLMYMRCILPQRENLQSILKVYILEEMTISNPHILCYHGFTVYGIYVVLS